MIQCFCVAIDFAMPRQRDHFIGSGDTLQVEVCALNFNEGDTLLEEKVKRMKLKVERERA